MSLSRPKFLLHQVFMNQRLIKSIRGLVYRSWNKEKLFLLYESMKIYQILNSSTFEMQRMKR